LIDYYISLSAFEGEFNDMLHSALLIQTIV